MAHVIHAYAGNYRGPPGSGDNYFIWDPVTGHNVAEDFDTLADIRAYVDRSRQNDWPLEES